MRTHLLISVLAVAACGDSAPAHMPDAAPDAGPDAPPGALGDILDELRAVPGLTVTEQSTMQDGYRFFVMEYDQPVDHHDPSGPHFQQRMTLLHRDYAAPVVAYNSGYFVSTRGGRSQIAAITEGNQLSLEYRYFSPSRPDPADWTKLDIWQAASDQHRITQALKARIYKDNKWLTTGASKGGMTSLFHRRFFPDDVDGTIAFVAPFDYPADEVQSTTNRYTVFLENVGTDPQCRQKLKDFQNLAIARRAAMKTRMEPLDTYDVLGEDRALEFAVEELPFIFWQYGSQSGCSTIPASTATDDAVFKFLDDTIDVASYGDQQLTDYLPYYHQSATQLGYPIDDESYLVGLQYPGEDTARAYVPAGIVTPAYDEGAAMQDVQSWIASSGQHILLIYGQYDPWSAGAVDLGNATDSFKFIAPAGNHGSSLANLASTDQATAVAAVQRWAGIAARRTLPLELDERTVEQDELSLRRRR